MQASTTNGIPVTRSGAIHGFRRSSDTCLRFLVMAFYYYLTRDADVVQDSLTVKNYIFDKYYNPSLGAMQWMLTSSSGVSFDDKWLVAQLEQMNQYLVLLTPMLSEPFQSEWKASLLRLCQVIIDQFYSPGERLFFLSGNRPEDKALATAGTDFGHNAKALWMIRWTGLITGSADLVAFAENYARVLFPRAYLDDCGCWAEGILRGGALDVDKSWRIFAELDQLAEEMRRPGRP